MQATDYESDDDLSAEKTGEHINDSIPSEVSKDLTVDKDLERKLNLRSELHQQFKIIYLLTKPQLGNFNI